MTVTIALSQAQFAAAESVLIRTPDWEVRARLTGSGIPALTIEGARVRAVILPWRGQQVWSLSFDGAPVGMRGMTDDPAAGQGLLDTFGAFFFHCGLLGTSAPEPSDSHPQHGELAVGAMSEAWIEIDDRALTVRSRRIHAQAFCGHYRAEPFTRFTPGVAQVEIGISVANLGRGILPFMYMGHPNFRPVDGAEIHWSGAYDRSALRLHTPVASAPEGTVQRALLQRLSEDPMTHALMDPGRAVDPEAVLQVDYQADTEGWAHTMQLHPDGTSDAVSHRVADLPRALRWIARQPDLDAVAMVEPATSWLGGYSAERAAGNVPDLAPGGTWRTEMRVARLNPQETVDLRQKIDRIAGRKEQP